MRQGEGLQGGGRRRGEQREDGKKSGTLTAMWMMIELRCIRDGRRSRWGSLFVLVSDRRCLLLLLVVVVFEWRQQQSRRHVSILR